MEILILLICLVPFPVIHSRASDAIQWDTAEYLEEQLKISKVELAKSYLEQSEAVVTKTYNIDKHKLWSRNVGKDPARTMNVFEKIFVLEGNRILSLSIHAASKNESSGLEEVAVINQDHHIKFLRSIVWKGTLYLLICYETGTCNLYTGKNNLELIYRPAIPHQGFPMDANFFTRDNQLYLVIADNTGRYPVPSVIYHWTGTYMDVVCEILTTGAVSVTTFNHKHSTIIIFAQSDNINRKLGSEVYEFKANKVERIQFLSTNSPIAVHHYSHDNYIFVLMINEAEPSIILWWDGKELLPWLELDGIEANSLVNVAHFNGDTLFFVSHETSLQLCRVINKSLNYTCTPLITLNSQEIVVDMGIFITGNIVTLILITRDTNNWYRIEPWELTIHTKEQASVKEDSGALVKCFADLNTLLKHRVKDINDYQQMWPSLYSSSENLTITEPLEVENLILGSGDVSNIDLILPDGSFDPEKIEQELKALSTQIEETFSLAEKTIQTNKPNVIRGNLTIVEAAQFQYLQANSLEVELLNDEKVELNTALSAKGDQEFSVPLEGEFIAIGNLEIKSHCGIPFEYWLQTNESTKTSIDVTGNNNIFILNDTISVSRDLVIQDLRAKRINDIDLDDLFDNLFIIGRKQTIKGNVHFKNVQILNLTAAEINGKSADQYFTKTTDQNLKDFKIKTLEVSELITERINGVPVSEAARVSQKNVIKGEVIIADLHVTEELIIDGNATFPEIKPVQIYDDVTIQGDVFLKNLDLETNVPLILNKTRVNIPSIFSNHWTKSSNQTIPYPVRFTKGITIDELRTKYLNNLREEDFLYTTVEEIPEAFGNLHFMKFHTAESFYKDHPGFYSIDKDFITFHQKIHICTLRTDELFTPIFNGVPISTIMEKKDPPESFLNSSFKTIIAKKVKVDDFELKYLNDRKISDHLKSVRYIDEDFEVDFWKTKSNLHVFNLEVEEINGLNVQNLTNLLRFLNSTIGQNLVIDGDLKITSNLQTDKIDGEPVSSYLEKLAQADIRKTGSRSLNNLTITGNLTMNVLLDTKFNDFMDNIFLKSKPQVVNGSFSFRKISAANVTAEFLNDLDTRKLRWTDDPLTFEENISFTKLTVTGDTNTSFLNGREVNEIYESLLRIPSKKIKTLLVTGNVSWENASSGSNSLSYLLQNAVTKNTDQTITGEVAFLHNIQADCVKTLDENPEVRELEKDLLDTMILGNSTVRIAGEKTFTKNLTVKGLIVSEDTKVLFLNDENILHLNSTLVRKFEDEIYLTDRIVFRENIKIDNLTVNGTVHGRDTAGLVLSTDVLPPNTVFEKLVVRENIFSEFLDDIGFDEFIKNRVTLSGTHEIFSEVHFEGPVIVNNAVVGTINGINPKEYVFNGVEETQVITGAKTFETDLVVDGHFYAPIVNNVNIFEEYSNGITNDEDVEIFGDLIFEADVKILSNNTYANKVNGMDLNQLMETLQMDFNSTLGDIKSKKSSLENQIHRNLKVIELLSKEIFYLEEDKTLQIPVTNVQYVDVVYFESVTRLNMYSDKGRQSEENCCCRRKQYVAELTEEGCQVWELQGNRNVYNFPETNGVFGINVETNATAVVMQCMNSDVTVSISWIKPETGGTESSKADVFQETFEISGFLSDVKVFTYNDKAYIVLAINYDWKNQTYVTDSLIYAIDLSKNTISLMQKIPTNGAWRLEVFKIPDQGTYLLIGSSSISAESLLFQFHPSNLQFQLLRSFPANGTKNLQSLRQESYSFILLEDSESKAVYIYKFSENATDFEFYQNLFFDTDINSIDVFYAGEFGESDVFVTITTDDGQYYIYEFMFAGKFQIRFHNVFENLQILTPFSYLKNHYIFAGKSVNSTILRIVEQGP